MSRAPSSHYTPMGTDSPYHLPADLPVPVDDGAARHLAGAALPSVALPSTSGGLVRLDDAAVALAVVYCYPRTGRPEAVALGGTASWNAIPGARRLWPEHPADGLPTGGGEQTALAVRVVE